ncbi:Type I Iterative PKS [Elasticomyces elasticus]|nr:Type I Iterative PKS [Elasticomyces elasticus]
MDPQIRLQLESTFEALENAGIPISKIARSNTSVFAGAFFRDYHDALMRDLDTLPRYFMTGNGAAMISNRISHFFDLRGPSATVDTGCSTALTALHLACQSIRTGDAKISIVGGANIMLNPDMFISMSSLGLLGPDGKSYTFDHRAQGYGRREGVATVVLKSVEDALNDDDPIRAIIRESALNQDGKTPTITSPSGEAQEELIRTCYRRAGLNPLETSYVEAHGTGTQTGDPTEAGAIGAVLGQARLRNKPLYIGSVKSNIGHLEAASGLASVIKVAMAFEKGFIPPSINFQKPNPSIHLDKWTMKVPLKLEAWPAGQLRRASLSNFGYGGTNAHVIMEDPSYHQVRKTPLLNGAATNGTMTNSTRSKHAERRHVFFTSARDEGAAKTMIANLRDFLKAGSEQESTVCFRDLAYTLGQRRSVFPWVAATSAETLLELTEALEDKSFKPTYSSRAPRLGFVFNGQGAQWYAMGRELIDAYPVFAQCLEEADQYLQEFGAQWSLIDELMRDASTTRVNEPLLSLPLSCAIQIALVRLLASWGIKPTAVTGHSSGEVGAAYAAGAIDLREALAIVYVRGALTTAFLKTVQMHGGMLAVGLGPGDVTPYLLDGSSGKAVIACVNSASSVTLSGDLKAIEELESTFTAKGVFARRVKVEAAYHSHHMQPLAKDYLASLRQNLKQDGDFKGILYSSPVTGEWIEIAQELGPEHWVRNMAQPVLFAQSLRNMCIGPLTSSDTNLEQHVDTVVEIGPHGALAGPIRQTLMEPGLKDLGITYCSCLTRGENAVQTMQSLACFLLSKGYPIDLAKVNFPRGVSEVKVVTDLPPYPWNHSTRFWMEPRLNKEYRHRKYPPHDLLGTFLEAGNSLSPTWRHIIRPTEVPWVRDHLVQSDIVYPGAGCIIMAVEAVRQLSRSSERPIAGYRLRDIEIMKALVIPDTQDGVEVQLSLQPPDDKSLTQDWREFHVYSVSEDRGWSEHCKGLISVDFEPHNGTATGWNHNPSWTSNFDYDITSGTYTRRIEPKDFYKSLQAVSISHGPSFQNLIAIQTGYDQSVATFQVADTASIMPGKVHSDHVLHPITLDALFQAAYSALPASA